MSKKVITFYDSEKQSHDFPIITPDYGTCSTASNTSAKVVTCDDFSLFTGAEITVKFTNVPTTDTITLNVNNSGAKNVDFSACGNKPYDEIKANGCYGFVYDGTSWIYKGSGKGASKEELERLQYYGDKDIIPSDSSYFTVNSTGETITGLTNAGKTMMDLVIPYKINGVKITRLYSGDKFKSILDGATEVRYVTIPNSVTDISNYAFNNCTDLRFINIPNSVKSIGNDAFNNCTRLESISIPNSVTSIGWAAFENCTSLTSIDIPNNVTSIGDDVFNGCTSLKSINIPNSVKRIGVGTFNGCTALNSITIPNSVTDIKEAFSGCTSLARVIIPNSVTYIADSTFSGYTNLTIYCEQGSYAETYANTNNIPVMYTDVKGDIATETELKSLKFYGDKDVIPSDESYFTVNSTGETITGLTDTGKTQTELVIPYKINGKEITTLYSGVDSGTPQSILYGSSTITKITIPKSVTTLGRGAFYICPSLTSINIPDSVTSIGYSAFQGCSGLLSIEIPNSVTSIGQNAFAYCSSLTSVSIPNSVTSIEHEAFYGCSSLTSIDIPNSVTSIGEGAFDGCTSLTSINIPNSVTSIGQGAFNGCTALTSVSIPNSVTSIGVAAFYGCSSLTSIDIPNSVTSIGRYAFRDCTSLTSVSIPNSVTSIDEYAFHVYNAESGSFAPISGLTVYCEQGSYAETYANTNGFSVVYTDISATDFNNKADKATTLAGYGITNAYTKTEVDTKLSTVYKVKGSANDYTVFRDSANHEVGDVYNLKAVYTNSYNTTVDKNAFQYYVSQDSKQYLIDELNIPYEWLNNAKIKIHTGTDTKTGVLIETRAVTGWELILDDGTLLTKDVYNTVTSIDLTVYHDFKVGDNVVYIKGGFWDKLAATVDLSGYATETELERLKYYGDPDIVPSDESYFTVNETGETITGLTDTGKTQTELVIPYEINGKEITNLGNNGGTSILNGNTVITKVVIPNSVTSIGYNAFSGCTSLASINIPNSVTSIEPNTFYHCTSLTSVNIPDSVTSIGIGAFDNCTSLTSINIPNGVTSIGAGAFSNCASLTSINIPNGVTSIGNGAFKNCTSLKSINIPNSITSIGKWIFKNCTSLRSITIPNSVTNIANDAFSDITPSNLTIYCEQGSYAETYAKSKNIPIMYTDIDPSKYLTKDNTTEYTPAADYQPATKKYVDDAINASSSGEATNVSTVKTCTGDELISITSPAVGSIRYVSIAGTGDNVSITPGLYFYLDSWKKVAIEDTAIISNEFVSGGDSTSINN